MQLNSFNELRAAFYFSPQFQCEESLKTFPLPADFQQKMWHGIFSQTIVSENDEENSRKTLRTAAKVAAISENAFLWVFETLESNRCRLLKYSQRNYSVVQKLVCDLWPKNEFLRSQKCFSFSTPFFPLLSALTTFLKIFPKNVRKCFRRAVVDFCGGDSAMMTASPINSLARVPFFVQKSVVQVKSNIDTTFDVATKPWRVVKFESLEKTCFEAETIMTMLNLRATLVRCLEVWTILQMLANNLWHKPTFSSNCRDIIKRTISLRPLPVPGLE